MSYIRDIPIKFRGVSKKDERQYYGDLVHDETGATFIQYLSDGKIVKQEVYEHSIRQLWGYDANFNEIYEGDEAKYHYYEETVELSGDEKIVRGKVARVLDCTIKPLHREKKLEKKSGEYRLVFCEERRTPQIALFDEEIKKPPEIKPVIKFRGRRWDFSRNTYFYGDLEHIGEKVYIRSINGEWYEPQHYIYSQVDPDSVEQFCGYDDLGNEVWENVSTKEKTVTIHRKEDYNKYGLSFRGRDIKTGEFVEGIPDITIEIKGRKVHTPIQPSLGYDKDGKNIYQDERYHDGVDEIDLMELYGLAYRHKEYCPE